MVRDPGQTIDEYIAAQSEERRPILQKVRETIRAVAPDAVERISYQMPCFWQDGPLIYFAAMKNHLGIYPTADGMEAFKDRLTDYKTSKGAVQFPYNKPIPYDLIKEKAAFRVRQAKGKKDGTGRRQKRRTTKSTNMTLSSWLPKLARAARM